MAQSTKAKSAGRKARKNGSGTSKAPAKSEKSPKSKGKAKASEPATGGRTTLRQRRVARREAAAERSAAAENPRWKPGDRRQLLARSDVDRPHMRLAFLWAVLVVVALALGPLATAAAYGVTAGIAAMQSAIAWKRAGRNPNRVVAGTVALAVPIATGAAEWGLGVAILVGVAVSVFKSAGSSAEVVRDGATTVRCWLFASLASASVVAAYHYNVWAAVSLVALAASYDAGDYIFGADSRHRWLGLVAGSCAVAAVSFSLWVIQIAPFGGDPVFLFAAALILTAPLGQVVASFVLPDGRALASGLRRLDTLIVAGPVWVLLLWYYPL